MKSRRKATRPVVQPPESLTPESRQEERRHAEEQWSRLLWEVLSDETKRAAMVQAGHEQARRFSWRSTAQQTLAVYQRVLEG